MTSGNNNLCAYCGTEHVDSDNILDGEHMVCEDCYELIAAGIMTQTLVEESNDDFMHVVHEGEINEYFQTPDAYLAELMLAAQGGTIEADEVPIL